MSTFTTNKTFEQPANGSYSNTWDTPVNADWAAIDACFGGTTTINPTSTGASVVVLTLTQYRPPNIVISAGTLTAGYTNVTYQIPSGVGGFWSISNACSAGTPSTTSYTVTITSGGGGSSVVIQPSTRVLLFCDGTNVFSGQSGALAAAGSTTQVQYNSSGSLAGSSNLAFDGNNFTVGGSTVNATFTGSTDATGTVLTTSGVTGTIAAGQKVYAPSIPSGATISGSGPTYTISPAYANLSAQPMFSASTGEAVNGYLTSPYATIGQLVLTRAAALSGLISITGTGTTGTMDNVNLGQTTPALAKFTQAATPIAASINSGTAFTLNCALSNVFTLVMTGNVPNTGWTISNPVDGQTINLFITQGSGPFTLAWPSSFKFPGGSTGVSISTTNAYVDLLVMTYRATPGYWYCTLSKNFS